MKRLLAVMLVVAMVFGMSTIGYATTGDSTPQTRGSGRSVVRTGVQSTSKAVRTNGTWSTTDKGWQFKDTNGKPYTSRWGYIYNPYAKSPNKYQWFYFDVNGNMLTGWQKIKDADGLVRWYYLNPVSDGELGKCLMNTTTPDGYTVDANGAWTVNGVVQIVK